MLILITLYLVIGVVYFVARFGYGEDNVITTLGNLLIHWYLALSIVLLPLAIVMRGWVQSIGLTLFLMYFGVLFGALFFPNPPVDPAIRLNAAKLRVMTFNTAGQLTRPTEFSNILLQTRPDVLGLMEVSQDGLALFANEYRDEYPYQFNSFGGDDHKAIISRFPIVAQETFQLETARTNIHVQLDIEGQRVHVFLVHPPAPDFHEGWNFYRPHPSNAPEIAQLIARIPQGEPLILLGDFNFTDQQMTHWQLYQVGMKDAFREVGEGFGSTYNIRSLLRRNGLRIPALDTVAVTRIDYVWYSAPLLAESAFVGPSSRSDHRPIVADLLLPSN